MRLHNHPDVYDNLNLSIADFNLTNRLYYACLPFGMEIIDHLILADGTYYSFLENGYMSLIHDHPKYKSYDEVKPQIEQEKEDYGEEQKYNKAVEIAKNLLKLNLDIKDIIKVTGFSKKEIEKLK